MKKRTRAFYDLFLYFILCAPFIVIEINVLVMLIIETSHESMLENWYLVISFAISFMIPFGGAFFLRYYTIENGTMQFYYFPFTKSWYKAFNNIDFKWNQLVIISQVEDVEIVKLTKEEKQTKVFYRHWFNKYLKINSKHANPKYVYVGNYSNCQIKKIISLLKN